MLEQAIAKVRTEMTQNNADSYIQVVGGFLLDRLDKNPQEAEKILVADKTIAKSLDEIWEVAKKKLSKNCAMLTPQEGFTIVMKYFEINAIFSEVPVTSAPAPVPAPLRPPKPLDNDFDISLDDLLQGV